MCRYHYSSVASVAALTLHLYLTTLLFALRTAWIKRSLPDPQPESPNVLDVEYLHYLHIDTSVISAVVTSVHLPIP